MCPETKQKLNNKLLQRRVRLECPLRIAAALEVRSQIKIKKYRFHILPAMHLAVLLVPVDQCM